MLVKKNIGGELQLLVFIELLGVGEKNRCKRLLEDFASVFFFSSGLS